ncbi:hypothetical protein KDL01_17285, partial [Actinospica durhamensis]
MAAAPWFTPEAVQTVPTRQLVVAVKQVTDAVGYVTESAHLEILAPWLNLARTAAARADADAEVLRALSGVARRLGVASEALAWCEAALALEDSAAGRTASTLVMLGYAQRDTEDPAAAAATWSAAFALDPSSALIPLDLADLAFTAGDFTAAHTWAERTLENDPASIKARGAVLAAQYRASVSTDGSDDRAGDVDALIDLTLLAHNHPGTDYLRQLGCPANFGHWSRGVITRRASGSPASLGRLRGESHSRSPSEGVG